MNEAIRNFLGHRRTEKITETPGAKPGREPDQSVSPRRAPSRDADVLKLRFLGFQKKKNDILASSPGVLGLAVISDCLRLEESVYESVAWPYFSLQQRDPTGQLTRGSVRSRLRGSRGAGDGSGRRTMIGPKAPASPPEPRSLGSCGQPGLLKTATEA